MVEKREGEDENVLEGTKALAKDITRAPQGPANATLSPRGGFGAWLQYTIRVIFSKAAFNCVQHVLGACSLLCYHLSPTTNPNVPLLVPNRGVVQMAFLKDTYLNPSKGKRDTAAACSLLSWGR